MKILRGFGYFFFCVSWVYVCWANASNSFVVFFRFSKLLQTKFKGKTNRGKGKLGKDGVQARGGSKEENTSSPHS